LELRKGFCTRKRAQIRYAHKSTRSARADVLADIPAVQPNQAERILFALESMRKTPLADARKSQPVDTLPASLIGSSSRQIRRAINVPLATAQAGESARQRRDKERLGGDERVSVMISPYGRRRAVESEQRERSVATGKSSYNLAYWMTG
jgi:nucleoporin NUP1